MPQWITDAQLAHDISAIHLHQNADIEAFLDRGNQTKTIIVASKGMGKTLVMRHKRDLLQRLEDGILLIPRDEQSDYVNLPSSPSETLIEALEEPMFWEDLWRCSIIVSILLNMPQSDKSGIEELSDAIMACGLPDSIRRLVLKALQSGRPTYQRPSTILNLFLEQNRKVVEQFRSKGIGRLWDLYLDTVQSACAVFIDSFDQGLSERFNGNLKIWASGQTGLLKAAWELSRRNRHVKVYVTVRQEAYASFDDSSRLNMSGSVLLLRYTQDDLRRIFELAIEAYDKKCTIAEFLGFEKMYNFFLRRTEDGFGYIYRHTIGVPRWLIILGQEIARIRPQRTIIADPTKSRAHQKEVARRVNETAGNVLARAYLQSELRLFFEGRDPIAMIMALLKRNQSTVLSMANLRRLSEVYRQSVPDALDHPFCLLMNVGLLGHVIPLGTDPGNVQTFKRPFEFYLNYHHILPEGDNNLFLLHPSLHFLAQMSNINFRFMGVRIGDELPWTRSDDRKVRDSKCSLFISYSHADWDTVSKVVQGIENRFNEKSRFLDLWIDRYKLKAGDWFLDQMSEAAEAAEFLVFMVSRDSLQSTAVQAEWQAKYLQGLRTRQRTLLPFIIDDSKFDELPLFLRGIHAYRYVDGPETVTRLVDDIIARHER